MAKPYSLGGDVATVLAQICCHEGRLPQGAATSPIISNIIAGQLDTRLKHYANEKGLFYTRYADDITLSTKRSIFPKSVADRSPPDACPYLYLDDELRGLIKDCGFNINDNKTRLLGRDERQDVTGLTVNRFVNVRRSYIRNVRAALHAWERYGLQAAQEVSEIKYALNTGKPNLMLTLQGRIQMDWKYKRLERSGLHKTS